MRSAALAVLMWVGVSDPAHALDLEARALIEPVREATLSAELGAAVIDVPFAEGSSFKAGDLLVRLDCRLFNAQHDKVMSDLRSAAAKLKSDTRLESLGSIGALELVLSQAAVDQAKAESRITGIQTERCVIRAPWSGRIAQVHINPHENVKVGEPLVDLVSNAQLRVRAIVPSDWIRWIKQGDTFVLWVDETASQHAVTVDSIGAQVDSDSQTLNLIGFLGGDDALRPGMSGRAVFNAPDE